MCVLCGIVYISIRKKEFSYNGIICKNLFYNIHFNNQFPTQNELAIIHKIVDSAQIMSINLV